MKTLRVYGPPGGVLDFDLKDFIGLLSPIAPAQALWRVSPVVDGADEFFEATGPSGEKLEALAQSGKPVSEQILAQLAEDTTQVIWGQFACGSDMTPSTPWLILRAIDSSFFEVTSADEKALSLVISSFADVRLQAIPWKSPWK